MALAGLIDEFDRNYVIREMMRIMYPSAPSGMLEELAKILKDTVGFPEDLRDYTKWGTVAHTLGRRCKLNRKIQKSTKKFFKRAAKRKLLGSSKRKYDQAMAELRATPGGEDYKAAMKRLKQQ
jgi:hypothetical protein